MTTVHVRSGLDSTLSLQSALLLYTSNEGGVYATHHPVQIETDNPARKIIGAGVPLTKDALASFAAVVGAATSYGGFVPDNLLYTAPNIIAWWTPEAVRSCWFKSAEKSIGTVVAPVAHPAMVFVATPGDWYVFALKNSERPTPDTQLSHSPHFNVWERGRVCTGNIDLPKSIDVGVMAAYEKAFFNSNFTHPNRDGAVNGKGGMKGLWRDQIKQADPEGMRRALRPAGETLREAISRITNHQKPI